MPEEEDNILSGLFRHFFVLSSVLLFYQMRGSVHFP